MTDASASDKKPLTLAELGISDLKRAVLGSKDVLVCRVGERLTHDGHNRISQTLRDIFPNNKVVVLDLNVELEVVETS